MDIQEIEVSTYISVGLSLIAMLGGALSWVLNLKIKHDILANNAKLEKDMEALKDRLTKQIDGVNDNYIRELSAFKEKMTDRMEEDERNLVELRTNLSDRIINTVNGKYVRSDLHQQTIAGIQDRLSAFKQIIEVSMEKIEQNLDRQILDLKERIFHSEK